MGNVLRYFLLLIFSIVVGVGAYRLADPTLRSSGKVDFSSFAFGIPSLVEKANSEVKQMNPRPPSLDLSCNCKILDQTFTELKFDSAESCAEGNMDRNYLHMQLERFKKSDREGDYFSPRPTELSSEKDVPLKCVMYVMKGFLNYSERPQLIEELKLGQPISSLFGKCERAKGKPKPIFGKPCLTEEYVFPIYNAFVDVTNCLNHDQRLYLPKLFIESGFHINASGPGGDGGIGQFTKPAILEANKIIPQIDQEIRQNPNPSCRRLAKYLKNNPDTLMPKGNLLSENVSERCAFLHSPPNPIRSLIYYAALQNQQKSAVSEKVDQLEGLMKQAGLANQNLYSREAIKESLYLLAYNVGPSGAQTLFKNWLQFRSQKHPHAPFQPQDFDFNLSIPDEPFKDIKMDEAEKLPLTFPQYLKVFRKGYLRVMAIYKERLDTNLGAGQCTPAQFLKL